MSLWNWPNGSVECACGHFALIVNAENGKIITTLPTDVGVYTVAFNPAPMEAMSAEEDGTMTFIKDNSSTSFEVEQTLDTKTGANPRTRHEDEPC
jgi:hypothetical protein